MTTNQIAKGVTWFLIIIVVLIVLNIAFGIIGFLFNHWFISLVLLGGGYYWFFMRKPKKPVSGKHSVLLRAVERIEDNLARSMHQV